jgi:putative ABC transport system permease protein
MLRNYLLAAIRHLIRQRVFSIINIFGLALGLSAFLLIYLFVQHELSFEQNHIKADRIYRLSLETFLPKNAGSEKIARIGSSVGDIVKQDFPQVDEVIKIRRLEDRVVQLDSKTRFYESVDFVDPEIFEVFTIPMLAGDPETALLGPSSVVISERIAKKYFGERSAIGSIITLPEDTIQLKVVGVIENLPSTTHLQMDMIAPYQLLDSIGWFYDSWWDYKTYTYLLLNEGADPLVFEEQVRRISARYTNDKEQQSGYRQEYFIQPIKDIHLRSKLRFEISPNSDIQYVYIFSLIGLLILILASVNFMNLSTASSTVLAKEIGLRKVIGASKRQLVTQLLGESMLITILSMIIGICFVFLALPLLKDLTGKEFIFDFSDQKSFFFIVIAVCITVGLGAGIYPALFLSAFNPSKILRGTFNMGFKGVFLRKALLVFQFVISTILIASTLIIYQQIRHMLQADLGFSKEQVVFLPTHGGVGTAEKFTLLKTELEEISNIRHASLSSQVPGSTMSSNNVRNGWADGDARSSLRILAIDYDFLDLYQIKLLAGRGFEKPFGTDNREAFLLNKAGMKRLGWSDPIEALGQKVRWKGRKGKVIGIIDDIYFTSVQNPIEPILLVMGPWRAGYLSLSIPSQNVEQALDQVQSVFNDIMPERTFEYEFLDEYFEAQYNDEQKFGKVLSYLTFLALVIACLGLFGLAGFTISRRKKEVAIRKVFGAALSDLSFQLGKNVLFLVLIAWVIAIPFSWIATRSWLEGFAYRIDHGALNFLIAGIVSISVAILTISYHVFKTAQTNPVDSLRSD